MNKFVRIARRLWHTSPSVWQQKLLSSNGQAWHKPDQHVWCLSTGRVGTQTLAALGQLSKGIKSEHEPKPLMYGLSRLAYSHSCSTSDHCSEVFKEGLRVSRELKLPIHESCYLETSPQMTFLAQFIYNVYPQSRFIHVVRHPSEVIASGMRRRWYDGHSFDKYRIVPMSGEYADNWSEMSVFQKNIWLWMETNRWIRKFMQSVPEDKKLTIRSEDLFAGDEKVLKAFYGILDSSLPANKHIQNVLDSKLNQQKKGSFPSKSEWTEAQRQCLIDIAGKEMAYYGYAL